MKQRIFDRARFVALILSTLLVFSMFNLPVNAALDETIEVTIVHDQDGAREMLPLINSLRANPTMKGENGEIFPLSPLGDIAYDYSLEKIAILRAEELGEDFKTGIRPDGTGADLISIDGISSNCEYIFMGTEDAVSTFNEWADINDPLSNRHYMIDPVYQSIAIAHVIFDGTDYWVAEMSRNVVNTTPTASNNSTTTKSISIREDAILGVTVNGGNTINMSVGDEIELPNVVGELSYGYNFDSTVNVPDSQLKILNWYTDSSDISIENGKIKALNVTFPYADVYVKCSFSGLEGLGSVRVCVSGNQTTITPTPTGSVTETPVPTLVDLTPDNQKNITVKRGSTVTLEALYNADEVNFFASEWLVKEGNDFEYIGESSWDVNTWTIQPYESCEYCYEVTAECGKEYETLEIFFKITVVDELHEVIDNTSDSEKNIIAQTGERVTLNARATGDSVLSYKWQQKIGNSYIVLSEKSSSYSFTCTYSTQYRCTVSDAYGNSIDIDYIVSQPKLKVASNQTSFQATSGQQISMVVNATTNTNGTLQYSWTKNGVPVPNASAASLGVTVDGSATYVCTVTDGYTSESIEFTVTVYSFSAQAETAQTFYVLSGNSVQLGVSGSSNYGTVTYQWYQGTSPISNATSANYTANPSATTSYKCLVSDGNNSQEILFNVYVPVLTASSSNTGFAVTSGSSVSMKVDAVSVDSDKDLTYTWYKGTTKINGASGSQYTVTANETSTYRCDVSNGYNTVSIDFTVTVTALTAYAEKADIYVVSGGQATMKVNSNTAGVTYTWYNSKGNQMSGTATSEKSVTASSSTSYYCIVSKGASSVRVDFNIIVPTLNVSADQNTFVVAKNQTVELKVNTTSSGTDKAITYKWMDGTTVLSQGESGTYNLSASFESSKNITCVVNDGYNEKSVVFTVKVPVLTASASSDTSFTCKNGNTVNMSVSASSPDSDKSITYTWKKNGTTLNESSSALSVTVSGAATYTCTVFDGYNTSDIEFTVSVPILTIDSTSNLSPYVKAGDKVTMSVTASSTKTVNYRWYLNNGTSSLSSTSTYSPKVNSSCKYRCVVSDGYNSEEIIFNVTVPVLTLGDNTTTVLVKPNTDFELIANATSNSNLPLTYQWYIGSSLQNETGNTLTYKTDSQENIFCDVSDGYNTKRITYTLSFVSLSVEGGNTSVVVKSGNSATLTVSALSNPSNVTYVWSGPSGVISSATTNSCVITPTVSGKYYCEISNGYLTEIREFDVTVPNTSASAVNGPTFTVKPGGSVTMEVEVNSNVGYEIKWYENTTNLVSGSNNKKTLTINNITTDKSYRCKITDNYGDPIYIDFSITVDNFSANAEKSTVYAKSGTAATLKVVTDPSLTGITYQWFAEGSTTPISGANSSTYSPVVTSSKNYTCKVIRGSESLTIPFSVIVPVLNVECSGDHNIVLTDSLVRMAVTATSNSDKNITYTWSKNGSVISNETGNSVSFTATENVTYNCVVSDGYNSVTYVFETIIPELTVVSTAPLNQNIAANTTVNLGVTATKNGSDKPITYSWSKDGVAISGATKATYSFTSATGTYKCTVSDGYNEKTIVYNVTVSTLTAQAGIANTTIYSAPNKANDLIVSASSSLPITYTWYANGTVVSGAKTSTYSPSPSETTNYKCRVSDGVNSVDINFTIKVPVLSATPNKEKFYVVKNESFSMQVFATSDTNKDITYQWYKGSNKIGGATGSTYSTSITSNATFSCKVDDGYTTVTVTFSAAIPTFDAQASTATSFKVKSGSEVSMGVTAVSQGSDQPLTYVWKKGNEVLSNSTSSLKVNPTENCSYSCTVSDGHNVKTITFTITVPVLNAERVSNSVITVSSNSTAKMQVSATSSETVNYKWYVYGSATPISGATQDTYSPAVTSSTKYVCKISDGFNEVEFTFEVKVPKLTADSNTKTFKVASGSQVSMTVTASTDYGNEIKYQWYTTSDDAQVIGATNKTLTINPTASTAYYCIASDGFNTKRVDFTITVPTLSVSAENTSYTIVSGSSASLSVTASTQNGNPVTYKWYVKGNAASVISTAANCTVSPTEYTVYTCEVEDGYNTKTIDITVFVNQPNLSDNTTEADRNRIVKRGTSDTLTAKVTTNTAVTYKWQKLNNGTYVDVADGNQKTLSIAPTVSTKYRCIVSNSSGSITIEYNITVPTLTDNTKPTSFTISKGASQILEVDIEGTGTLTYSWKKNGTVINGAKSAALTTDALDVSATYSCTVRDGYENSKTVIFTITVPTLTITGSSETVDAGKNKEFTLNVAATGTGTLHYSWTRIEGNNTTNVGSDSESFTGHESANVTYKCTVTDSFNNSVTKTFTINVHSFTASQNIESDEIFSGDSINLSVTATGTTGTVKYAWREVGSETVKGTEAEFTAVPSKSTRYSCTISDQYYEVVLYFDITVKSATLTDNTTIADKNRTVANGSKIILSTNIASDGQTLNYQWMKYSGNTWTNISNATASSYEVTVSESSKYRCAVTDSYNHSCNVDFNITVPVLTVDKTSYSYFYGTNAKVTLAPIIKVNSGSTPNYTWYKDGVVISDETSSSYSTTLTTNAVYKCEIVDPMYNNKQTVTFTVTVYGLTATADNTEITIVKGESTQIGVTASTTSSNDIKYTWYSASNSPETKMSESSSKITVSPSSDTSYRCQVSDGYNEKNITINVVVTVTPTPDPITPSPDPVTTSPSPSPATTTPTPVTTTPSPATTTPTPRPATTTPAPSTPTPRPTGSASETDSIMAFVERMYSCVLARGVDKDGANFWYTQLYEFNYTGAEVAYRFLDSAEFKNRNTSDEVYVEILYRTFFNREPEPEGYNYWLNRLKAGESRKTISDGFIMSQEWADTCARYGIRSGGSIKPGISINPSDKTNAFVERMYTTCLGRDYDKGGRDYWANRLSNFDLTGEQLGLEFFMSPEFRDKKLSDEEFINRLYRTFMNREPEGDGKAFWLEYTKTHTRRETVLGFTRSEEFRKLCVEARILPC